MINDGGTGGCAIDVLILLLVGAMLAGIIVTSAWIIPQCESIGIEIVLTQQAKQDAGSGT